jgi:low temperature requirement protein LtrA
MPSRAFLGVGLAAFFDAALFLFAGRRRRRVFAVPLVAVVAHVAAVDRIRRRGETWPWWRTGLTPERFRLFVMLVLGESIASLVTGVHAFVAIAAAWWAYFDLGGAAGKRRLMADGKDQESGVADAYIYGHLPLSLGLAAFAVGSSN